MISMTYNWIYSDEVERLLREYKQNQELVRRLGSRYYQVVYPIQVLWIVRMVITIYIYLDNNNDDDDHDDDDKEEDASCRDPWTCIGSTSRKAWNFNSGDRQQEPTGEEPLFHHDYILISKSLCGLHPKKMVFLKMTWLELEEKTKLSFFLDDNHNTSIDASIFDNCYWFISSLWKLSRFIWKINAKISSKYQD